MTADEIKDLRARLVLTQSDLAKKLGITVDTVRKYEQGQRSPSTRITALLDDLANGDANGSAND